MLIHVVLAPLFVLAKLTFAHTLCSLLIHYYCLFLLPVVKLIRLHYQAWCVVHEFVTVRREVTHELCFQVDIFTLFFVVQVFDVFWYQRRETQWFDYLLVQLVWCLHIGRHWGHQISLCCLLSLVVKLLTHIHNVFHQHPHLLLLRVVIFGSFYLVMLCTAALRLYTRIEPWQTSIAARIISLCRFNSKVGLIRMEITRIKHVTSKSIPTLCALKVQTTCHQFPIDNRPL